MHDCIWILILWRIKGRGGGVVFDEWWTLSYNYYFSTIQLLYQWGPYFSHSGCVIWKKTTTTKKQILNIKLGDQFFFLSKFDLIPCRIFLFSISFTKYVYSKIPSYLLWEKKSSFEQIDTFFFVLRKFFAYFLYYMHYPSLL